MDLDDAVVVALGSNLSGDWGSSTGVLEAALARLAFLGVSPTALSSWWRSAAWPDPAEPDYINAVALVDTARDPQGVLACLHAVERAFGRERERPNAARVLDLDLIAHGRTVLHRHDLVLPHPRAAERRFVMGPLAEIAPGWRHPLSGATAQALAATARIGRDARPI